MERIANGIVNLSAARRAAGIAACCAASLAASAQAATPPEAISPGQADRYAAAAAACPTFSWVPASSAAGHDLVVYAVSADGGGSLSETPSLSVRLPGRASSFTPAAERCLSPGRYAWAVRARGVDDLGDEEAVAWSQPLLFQVREAPSEQELAEAVEVVRRYLAGRSAVEPEWIGEPSTPDSDRRRNRVPGERSLQSSRDQRLEVGRRGDVETSAVPERVGSAAGSEPTIVLGGEPVARLAASDFTRMSADDVVFDFHNPGDGEMRLRVDGVDVVTTATDQDTQYQAGNQLELSGTTLDVEEGTGSGLDADLLDGLDSTDFVTTTADPWVDETGDTMSGLLMIDPATGFALQTGAGDSIDVGGDVYRGGTLFLHATGMDNTGAGLGALAAVATGENDTAVGAGALSSNTSGSGNTAVGSFALEKVVSAGGNTAVGPNALRNNTAASNTAVGAYALATNTSGSNNTALGRDALNANQTGSSNTAIGRNALSSNTMAGSNTAVGANALDSNTTGEYNTAAGRQAMDHNQFGSRNTALGRRAQAFFTGDENTAVGESALAAASGINGPGSGSSNTAVGRAALSAAGLSGSGNIALGAGAGSALETGSSNILIGNPGVEEENGTTRIGTMGVHASTFIAGIHGQSVDTDSAALVYVDSSGRLGTVVPPPEPEQLEEEIPDIGSASERLLSLRPVSFGHRAEVTGKSEGGAERSLEYGLIAEEVAEVFPEVVVYDEAGAPSTVRYHLLVPLLLAEHQREHREIEALRREIAELRRVIGRGGP